MRQFILKAKDWLLPAEIFRLLTFYHPRALIFYLTNLEILRVNHQLRNRHKGKRCFILCNGPSVKEQDIRPLRDEIVFSVSNGYRHPDYQYISPKYHCIPQITYSSLPPEETVEWFREMNQSIGDAEMFLDKQEWPLVNEHHLFAGRKTHYVCMGKNHFPCNTSLPDLTGIIPRVHTVPILVLMIAMFMGFREIFLLGVDHDWFIKKEYRYFFDSQGVGTPLQVSADPNFTKDGVLLTTLWEDLPYIHNIWEQYRSIKQIAQAHGVKIYNATHGGMLDQFERVSLEDTFR